MTYVTQSEPMSFEGDPGARAQFRGLWAEYTAIHVGDPQDPARVLMFQRLLAIANRAPPGDYVELGVHRGLTARLIWRLMDPAQALYLFDTFEGFDARDLGAEVAAGGRALEPGGFLPTSEYEVQFYVGGTPHLNLLTIKGWLPESYNLVGPLRFVHVDLDLYEPIRAMLPIVWRQIVPGGVVVVHDCGCADFPGARKATQEFAASVGLIPVPMCDAWGSAVLVKPCSP